MNVFSNDLSLVRSISNTFKSHQPLAESQLRALVPAAFATEAHNSRSQRYAYIPTATIIEQMISAGFLPTYAAQTGSKEEDAAGHAKHMIRFRRGELTGLNDSVPEVVLINSHDGSSSYQLLAGIYRLVCLNGLVVGHDYRSVNVRHSGNAVKQVIEGSFEVIEQATYALPHIERMQHTQLTQDERMMLAISAHQLRFADSEVGQSIPAARLLETRRSTDNGMDLWKTLNVVQENVIRGRQTGWILDDRGLRARRVSTRAINGIGQSVDLNREIWNLAEQMLDLKAA
jgi:hypothetical protein